MSDTQIVQQALKTVDQAVIKALNKMIESRNAEIERLRAQVEQLTADAIVRADKQARLIQAMWNIQQFSIHPAYREVAERVLKEIGELK